MAVEKYLKRVGADAAEQAAIDTSAGVGDAGKIVALDNNGRLASNMMPVGFGAEVKSIVSFENLSAGDFVNIFNDAGTIKVRKADASNPAKRAHGYVLSAVTAPAAANVYYGNINNQKSGLTLGEEQFLSGSTAGATTETVPSTTGYIAQRLGVATATGEMLVEIQPPIIIG